MIDGHLALGISRLLERADHLGATATDPSGIAEGDALTTALKLLYRDHRDEYADAVQRHAAASRTEPSVPVALVPSTSANPVADHIAALIAQRKWTAVELRRPEVSRVVVSRLQSQYRALDFVLRLLADLYDEEHALAEKQLKETSK